MVWPINANEVSNDVSVLLGNGDGTFQAVVNYAASTHPYSVVLGDCNGDGKLDLVLRLDILRKKDVGSAFRARLPGSIAPE